MPVRQRRTARGGGTKKVAPRNFARAGLEIIAKRLSFSQALAQEAAIRQYPARPCRSHGENPLITPSRHACSD
jgi:hypothetical protein